MYSNTSQCWIINLNCLHILVSTQASQSFKVCSIKQVFTILSATSLISILFLKTRHIHSAHPCNLKKKYFLQQNYVQLDPKHMNQNCFHAIAQSRHYKKVYIIKITILSVHVTLILNLNLVTQNGIIQV